MDGRPCMIILRGHVMSRTHRHSMREGSSARRGWRGICTACVKGHLHGMGGVASAQHAWG
eukprot:356963-Chlamydomonas_euryale.AAC.3